MNFELQNESGIKESEFWYAYLLIPITTTDVVSSITLFIFFFSVTFICISLQSLIWQQIKLKFVQTYLIDRQLMRWSTATLESGITDLSQDTSWKTLPFLVRVSFILSHFRFIPFLDFFQPLSILLILSYQRCCGHRCHFGI